MFLWTQTWPFYFSILNAVLSVYSAGQLTADGLTYEVSAGLIDLHEFIAGFSGHTMLAIGMLSYMMIRGACHHLYILQVA